MALTRIVLWTNRRLEPVNGHWTSALAVARRWSRATDPKLKAKLALLIIRDATRGEVDPIELRKRALESYFMQSEKNEGALTRTH